ncbi:MAG: hypothetical protein HOV81_07680 [Kofleriaceae bacterium]|nr:hypothetical protein [Kofleriaceae bacterium]
MRGAVALALVAATTAGCDLITSSFEENDFSGDPFPTTVDSSAGALIVGVEFQGVPGRRTAVLDVLSPISVLDRGPAQAPSIDSADVTLLGLSAPGGELDLPRAQFPAKQVVTLHPCADPAGCAVGDPSAPRAFDALLGQNMFTGDALRLHLSNDTIFVLPDIAGSEIHRSRSCDAVLPSPFRGGGTLVIGGTEVGFGNLRIAIDACLAPNPNPLLTQSARGVNALLVMSTAVGVSIIDEALYERYRNVFPTEPILSTLPESSVLLPSGLVVGRLTSIPSIALVGNSSSNPRAPCRQMYASHLLAKQDCQVGDDCPCGVGPAFCPVPAVVELAPAARIPVLVVPNDNETLQALRTELRPDRPEVDGILGTSAFRDVEIDIDYTHDRLLARCIDRETCGARTVLADPQNRTFLNGCLGDMPGPIQ